MFFAAGRIRPIVLTAAFLVFGSLGHAHALEQQERNWNHGVIVVAQAETLSNTCARELAACGTVHKGLFGVEYVTPEDAARCRAAYQACLSGQQQSVQPAPRPPAALSELPASFVLNRNNQINYPLVCTIQDSRVSCHGRHSNSQGPGVITFSLAGMVSGNILDVEESSVYEDATGCPSRVEYRGRQNIVLEKGGRSVHSGSHTATQQRGASCPSGPTTVSDSYQNVIGSWRPN